MHGRGLGGHAGVQAELLIISIKHAKKQLETREHPKTHPTLLRSSRARERRGRHESRRRSAEGSRNSERVHHDIVQKFTLRDLDVVDRR